MKRVFTLSVAFILVSVTSFGASLVGSSVKAPARGPLLASDVHISVGNNGETVNLRELSTIKVADYEKLSGQRMNLIRRWEFKMAQKKLRHLINSDGTVNEKLAASLAREMDGTSGFHLGGFALGFLLSLIGVLIAYLINDEKKSNRVKWAWIGAAIGLLIWIVVIH